MSGEYKRVVDQLDDVVAALVAERDGPGRLVGAWEIMIETIDPMRPDVTAWMTDGKGSMLARRGLIEVCRDQYRAGIEDTTGE